MSSSQPIKGLFFDVFGTCVDWRGTVTRGLEDASSKALNAATSSIPSAVRMKASNMTVGDWGTFAQKWRTTYKVFTKKLAANPDIPYKNVDQHHYDSLLELLQEHALEGLWTPDELHDLSLIWHRLDPWSDSVRGIAEMNKLFYTCTLSNGNTSLLEDLRTHSRIPFTHIISAEMFNSYKPSPTVYLGGAEKMGLKPNECAMVAAHLYDLKAAKALGFAAVYVWRPQEEDMPADQVEQARKDGWVDVWVEDGNEGFVTAAEKLGVNVSKL
ncbi:haloacid dehalogenase [Rhizodiscina lignyota]|uniref:Haloacid dehalogenase n=1 Tax=Rhizodiscina lignyota TaxID=1504668 RepID=A0A9P4MDX4_9PEZI|nr:haloacid dehalogenase [Rhizodiscina lignyota]